MLVSFEVFPCEQSVCLNSNMDFVTKNEKISNVDGTLYIFPIWTISEVQFTIHIVVLFLTHYISRKNALKFPSFPLNVFFTLVHQHFFTKCQKILSASIDLSGIFSLVHLDHFCNCVF